MRTIKFRGMKVEYGTPTGEWLYGNLLDGNRIVGEVVEWNSDYFCTESWWTVDPRTVGQFTGLTDRNGKEIYEGDIIDGSWVNPMSGEKVIRHYKVAYDKGKFNAELIGHHPYGTTMLYFENEKSEVVGNIYENPELLQEGPKGNDSTE